MALIVEDGSGVANAESYNTVAEFKAYCDSRGYSYASMSDAKIEQNARKAFDYLLQKYRGAWKGYRKFATQIGDWPRSFVYLEPFIRGGMGSYPFLVDDTTIPREIKTAQFELMLRVDAADLTTDVGQQETSITVGPISVTFDDRSEQQIRYEAVDAMLKPYLIGGGRTSVNTVVRS